MLKKSRYQLKGRIWIETDSKTFIGEGKAIFDVRYSFSE